MGFTNARIYAAAIRVFVCHSWSARHYLLSDCRLSPLTALGAPEEKTPGGKQQKPGLHQKQWQKNPTDFIPRVRAQNSLRSGVNQAQ